MPRTTASRRLAVRQFDYSLMAGAANRAVVIPDFNTVGSSGQALTALIWGRIVNYSDTGNIFTHSDRGIAQRSWNIAVVQGGFLRVTCSNDGGTTNYKQYDDIVQMNLNNFHLFGFTFDAGTLRVYLDSADITSRMTKTIDATFTTLHNSSANILIGGQYNSGTITDLWDNLVTRPLLFGRVLSASEIADYYYDNYFERTSLRLEMLMTEGSGNSVADTSGLGNNGTGTSLIWSSTTPFKSRSIASTRTQANSRTQVN